MHCLLTLYAMYADAKIIKAYMRAYYMNCLKRKDVNIMI